MSTNMTLYKKRKYTLFFFFIKLHYSIFNKRVYSKLKNVLLLKGYFTEKLIMEI